MTSLHDYQRQALTFALDAIRSPARGCGLFLEPGLGKTLTSIALMDVMHRIDPTLRFLVVAPKLVALNSWPDELERWRDAHTLDWAVCVGTPKRREAALARDATVTIVNQDALTWLDKRLPQWPWRAMVVDELGGFRNTNSARTRTLMRRRRRMDWCVGLTGTPATKNLLDLYGEIAVIDGGRAFGTSLTRFRDRWFTPTRYVDRRPVEWEPRSGARQALLGLIEPFCLSMRASDRLPGLPGQLVCDEWTAMPTGTRAVYERIRRDMAVQVDERTVTAANAGVLTAKLEQLTCGCLYPDRDEPGPVERLDDAKLDLLDDIAARTDGPLLVFYRFTDELERLRRRRPDLREVHEDGVLDDWNHGRVPMLAAHPAAAKFGLNIQGGGHDIVWTCLPWAYDDYRQANDRLHRQGQTETVTVHRLLSEGSVDRRKTLVLEGRMGLHEAVMGALKG